MTRERVIVTAALIGLVIITVFLAYVSLTELGAAAIVGYQRTADERKIVVIIQTGLLTDVADREIKEDGATVRVTVHVRPHGNVPAIGIALPVLIQLQDRLGDRQVLDQKGASLKDLGMYQAPGSP